MPFASGALEMHEDGDGIAAEYYALSGYAETTGGGELVFSILVDYPAEADGLNTHCWKPMQDEICAILVTSEDG